MGAELVGTRSISEQVGEHLDDRFQTRLTFGSWVVPATGLIASGLLGIAPQSDVVSRFAHFDTVEVLARVQALCLVLAVVTVLVTVRCAVIRLPAAPVKAPTRLRAALFVGLLGIAGVAALEARIAVTARPVLIPVAALAGLGAAVIASFWMFGLSGIQAGPIVGLATVISGQLTVGWLPLAEPELASSPVPILMGMLLAGAAVAASVVEPFAPAVQASRVHDEVAVLDLSDREADVEFSLQRGHAALPLG